VPIPTAVLGRWLGSSSYQDQVVAAVFYGLGATVGLITFNLVWWYGAYGAKLTHAELSDAQRRAHTLAWGAAIPVLAILTAIAFISPQVSVAGFIAVIVAYVLPLAALVARIAPRSAPSGAKAARTQSTRSSEDVIIEFIVDDVDSLYASLTGYVEDFVIQPTTMPWGNRSLLFRDPDGNLVNFFTPVTQVAKEKFGR